MSKIKVVYKKLGRHKVKKGDCVGLAHVDKNLIEIEERLLAKDKFKTLIHELCHMAFPEYSETKILKAERIIGNILWNEGYRKIEQ